MAVPVSDGLLKVISVPVEVVVLTAPGVLPARTKYPATEKPPCPGAVEENVAGSYQLNVPCKLTGYDPPTDAPFADACSCQVHDPLGAPGALYVNV
jgi:hypothetical protein